MTSKSISTATLTTRQVVIAEQVKHAANPIARMKGLLGTKSLANGHALWLRPCNSIHTIGMAYAIDVIFLDKNNKIVKVVSRLKPMRLCWAPLATRSVLELPEGTVEKYAITVGDSVDISEQEETNNTRVIALS